MYLLIKYSEFLMIVIHDPGLISKQKVKQILSQAFLYNRNLLSPTIVSDTGNSLNSGDFVPFLK